MCQSGVSTRPLEEHLLSDNRDGLVANAPVTQASGTAERDAAAETLEDAARLAGACPLGGKSYDTVSSVASCRVNRVTPHVGQHGRPDSSGDVSRPRASRAAVPADSGGLQPRSHA
ncbi:protein of unknown function [Burkholderia multivorans]